MSLWLYGLVHPVRRGMGLYMHNSILAMAMASLANRWPSMDCRSLVAAAMPGRNTLDKSTCHFPLMVTKLCNQVSIRYHIN